MNAMPSHHVRESGVMYDPGQLPQASTIIVMSRQPTPSAHHYLPLAEETHDSICGQRTDTTLTPLNFELWPMFSWAVA